MRALLLQLIASTDKGRVDRLVSARSYGPNRLILGGGSGPAGGLFYVQHGRLELLITTPEGNERCMRILAESDLFGLECLHAPGALPGYQIRAVTYAAVVRVDLELVEQWLREVPEFRRRLVARMAVDLLRLEQERERTLAFAVPERLVCYLRCGEHCMNQRAAAAPEPGAPLPMAMLARRIGCSPAYLSRVVQRLIKRGVVQRVNQQLRLDRLENFSPCHCSVAPPEALRQAEIIRRA